MTGGKILAVDDDPELLRILQLQLESFHYEVSTASDGLSALEIARTEKPDLLILDVNLPAMNGLDVCRELRRTSMLPILMLSSHREDYDKIVGLEMGADDYLGKPCNPRELLARVRALLRRSRANNGEQSTNDKVKVGTLSLSPESHEAWELEKKLALTPIEFSLLKALMIDQGKALSREQLLHQIWGSDFVGSPRIVDTHVKNLRKKLSSAAPKIESVRSVGFKLTNAHF